MRAKIRPEINEDLCNGCNECALACPMQVIKEDNGKFTLLRGIACEDCTICYEACPTKAISLIDETHKDFFGVPGEAFSLPAHLFVKAYLYDGKSRGEVVEDYLRRLDDAGAITANVLRDDNYVFLIQADADRTTRYFRLDLSVDHYTEQHWSMSGDVDHSFGDDHGRNTWHPAEPGGEKFTDLEIILLDKAKDRPAIEKALGAARPYGSLAFDEKVLMFSSYYPDRNGRERYIVVPPKNEDKDEMLSIVHDIAENIVNVENYYHLLQRPRIKYQRSSESLNRIETAISRKIKTISAELNRSAPAQMKDWLQDLTTVYSKVTSINTEFRDLTMTTRMQQTALENALRDRGERKIFGVTPLSAPLFKNIQTISADGQRLSDRLRELRSEVADVIAILRTRTNLIVQEQSLTLQKAGNRTTRSQFKMQKSIEGLYVFIVAYYLTALMKIVLEAVEKTYGLPFTVIQGTALFIPIALLMGLYLSGKISETLSHRRKRLGSGKAGRPKT